MYLFVVMKMVVDLCVVVEIEKLEFRCGFLTRSVVAVLSMVFVNFLSRSHRPTELNERAIPESFMIIS